MFNDFLSLGAWFKLYLIALFFGGALAALGMGLMLALGGTLAGVSFPLVMSLSACLAGLILCGIALVHRKVTMSEWWRGVIVYVALTAILLITTLAATGKL